LFAREALGRWQILLDLRREVISGAKLTIKDIRHRCENHAAKQRAGTTGLTIRTDTGSRLGELLQTRTATAATPASKEFKETSDQLKKIGQKKNKRTPCDRDKRRMLALYVDPVSTDRWNRPISEIPKKLAYEVLMDALNDYVRALSERYIHPELFKDDPELFGALTGWADRPKLSRPDDLPFPVE
jgi:AbiV family abortive infection protein